MKLLLVRHGQTSSNVSGAIDTALPGAPLNATGLSQAESLPGRLAQAGLLEAIGSLWVSPVLRARQTMEPIARATGQEVQVREGLREVEAGELEMRTDATAVRCYTDTTRSWMVGRLGCRIPGGQDGEVTFARFNAVVQEIAACTAAVAGDDGTALLVAHGTVLRLWTALAAAAGGGADAAWIAEHPMGNTAVTVADGDPGHGWGLASWNAGEWTGA